MTTPLWCLVVVALLPYVWSTTATIHRARQFGPQTDNKAPRLQQAQQTGAGARAYAAQQNAWEALPFFTAGVVVAELAGAAAGTAAVLSLVFVAARVAHGIFYVADLDKLRSLSFLVGAVCVVGLFVISA